MLSDFLHKNMFGANPCSTTMTVSHKLTLNDNPPFSHASIYQSTIGALQYVTHTRPDISFAISKLNKFLHAPTRAHWAACKRLLRYIKATLMVDLSFPPASILNLEGFFDADWAVNLDDRRSMSGLRIYLGEILLLRLQNANCCGTIKY